MLKLDTLEEKSGEIECEKGYQCSGTVSRNAC
jgi:hypothetical protein